MVERESWRSLFILACGIRTLLQLDLTLARLFAIPHGKELNFIFCQSTITRSIQELEQFFGFLRVESQILADF